MSFDPNLRASVLATPGTRATMDRILAVTDLFLPSGPELFLFTTASAEPEAVRELLARGIRAIVVKNGAEGARYYAPDTEIAAPAFAVEEVDPTGAGDTFAGTFVTLWLRDTPPRDALRLANAVGGPRGRTQGSDGRHLHPRRDRRFPGTPGPIRSPLPPAGRRHHLGLFGPPDGHRSGSAPRCLGSQPGADRGDLQPGQPGRRLHRNDPGRLPRLRRGHRRPRRLPPRPADPRRRPPRSQSVEVALLPTTRWPRPAPWSPLCRRRLHQAPPRHQHGVRRRARRPARRHHRRARRGPRGRRGGGGGQAAVLRHRYGGPRARRGHPRPRRTSR